MSTHKINVSVNGAARAAEVEGRLLLVHLIREVFRLTGTHIGCDTTHCGACTVLLDGQPVKSCTVLAVQADGRSVRTVEGLETDGKLHPIVAERLGGESPQVTPGLNFPKTPQPTAAAWKKSLARLAASQRRFRAAVSTSADKTTWRWQAVEIGLMNEVFAEVLKGLKPGDKVVARPYDLTAPTPETLPALQASGPANRRMRRAPVPTPWRTWASEPAPASSPYFRWKRSASSL